ncbi:Clp protease N-terminal domain-containing protein [Streptomyces sp. NPDC021093]|uniref:Clp protease N-terminal domain-containing protein n=1 Tax=Streptomyces sp. NPDC021093 TaxID=3365112 RepID=UPI00379F8B57
MFERFTESARGVVIGAVTHAERLDAEQVTEEHLLLALMDTEGGRASFAFAALGIDRQRDAVAASLADARRRGGMSKAEASALADMGIDVDAIVAKVEETHGEGALGGRKSGRFRRGLLKGHRPFASGAKKAIEQSLRVAIGRGDHHIGDEHLLLALTARPGVVSDVLGEYGAGYGEVERAMFGGVK